MGHTAGIRNDGGDEGPLFGQHCERPVDALPAFASRELLFEPGTFFRFSNFGFIVVSAAVEAAAEEPFVIFMRKRVFEPLGMTHTDIDSQPPSEDQAVSYFPRFAADPRYGPDPMRPLDLSCYAGASVFVSTAADLVRFATAINGGSFLKPDTVQALQAAQRLSSGEETGYGLGWDIENLQLLGRPARAVGHDGELLGGNAASLMTFPDRGLAVVVIANTSYADTPGVALKIAQVFADAATDHGRR
jgi:CubicO group peptidase (beta-lactamase class C family)